MREQQRGQSLNIWQRLHVAIQLSKLLLRARGAEFYGCPDRRRDGEELRAQALDTDDVSIALQGIDQSTLKGARDYAILSVLLYTGRRAQEVATLHGKT